MDRNTKGIFGWFFLSLVFGIVMIIPMVVREWYQHITCPYNEFEWNDVRLYGFFICIGSMFHWCACDLLELPIWTMF